MVDVSKKKGFQSVPRNVDYLEKDYDWPMKFAGEEYSIVDVFTYPFMADSIQYLMKSFAPLPMPTTTTKDDKDVEAIGHLRECKCDPNRHKELLDDVGFNDSEEESSPSSESGNDSPSLSESDSEKISESESNVSDNRKEIESTNDKKFPDADVIEAILTGNLIRVSSKLKVEDLLRKKYFLEKFIEIYRKKNHGKPVERVVPLYEQIAAWNLHCTDLNDLLEKRPMPLPLLTKPVKLKFASRNLYKGYFDQMMLNGFSILKYDNGATYKGKLQEGLPHGFGMMTWEDGTYYQGTMKKNKLHGLGTLLFFKDKHDKEDTNIEMAHLGGWKNGKKHKHGLTVYGKNKWYEGNWEEGLMDGFGIRCYDEETYYVGFWKNGLRDGQGAMTWSNKDLYIGEWKEGEMHGFGTYTWRAYRVTDWLISPFQNAYVGEWKNGLRHGRGDLYLSSGVKLKATWKKGKKHGFGEIICTNGKRITSDNMFEDDKVADTKIPICSDSEIDPEENIVAGNKIDLGQNQEEGIEENLSDSGETEMENEDQSDIDKERKQNANKVLKPISAPAPDINYEIDQDQPKDIKAKGYLPRCIAMNAPLYAMNFDWHIYKLFLPENYQIYPKETDFTKWVPKNTRNSMYNVEREWLTKVLIKRGPELNFIYNKYATGGNSKQFPFKPALLRISLWKLIRDSGLFLTRKSLTDLDKEIGYGDKPFDQVLMFEMVHYLLIMSHELFIKQKFFNPNIPGAIASAFDKFIEDVLVPMAHLYVGNVLMMLRYVPLNALNELFDSYKKPMTVRNLVEIIDPVDNSFRDILPRPPKFIRKMAKGLNVFHPDGSIEHLPIDDPYFSKRRKPMTKLEGSHLSLLGLLGFNVLVQVILEVVPNVLTLEGSIKRDYELTFLDFCDILSQLLILYVDKAYGELDDCKDKDDETSEEDEAEDGENSELRPSKCVFDNDVDSFEENLKDEYIEEEEEVSDGIEVEEISWHEDMLKEDDYGGEGEEESEELISSVSEELPSDIDDILYSLAPSSIKIDSQTEYEDALATLEGRRDQYEHLDSKDKKKYFNCEENLEEEEEEDDDDFFLATMLALDEDSDDDYSTISDDDDEEDTDRVEEVCDDDAAILLDDDDRDKEIEILLSGEDDESDEEDEDESDDDHVEEEDINEGNEKRLVEEESLEFEKISADEQEKHNKDNTEEEVELEDDIQFGDDYEKDELDDMEEDYGEEDICKKAIADRSDNDESETSNGTLTLSYGDSSSNNYHTGEEDQLLEDLRFKNVWDESEYEEDMVAEECGGLDELLKDIDEDEDQNKEKEECEEDERPVESEEDESENTSQVEEEDYEEHECLEHLEDKISITGTETESDNLFTGITDKYNKSFLSVLLGSTKNYKKYPCLTYLEKSKRLIKIYNKLVYKSGMFFKKRYDFVKHRLEAEFMNKFIQDNLRKIRLSKGKEPANEEQEDNASVTQMSSSDHTSDTSARLMKFQNLSINSDSSDDWADRTISSKKSSVIKQALYTETDDRVTASVSTDSTFTPRDVNCLDDNPLYELNYSSDDVESERHGSESSPVTGTLRTFSDESSIGFTRIKVFTHKNINKLATKQSKVPLAPNAKPTMVVYRGKFDYKSAIDKFPKKITNAIFGKHGSIKRYINMLYRLGGKEVLEQIVDKYWNKITFNLNVIEKEDVFIDKIQIFLKNLEKRELEKKEKEEAEKKAAEKTLKRDKKSSDTISTKNTKSTDTIAKMKKVPKKDAKKDANTVIQETEEQIRDEIDANRARIDEILDKISSSEEEDDKNKNYDFDRYIHLFDISNVDLIDYDYFNDLPPVKNPLIVRHVIDEENQ